MKLLLAATLAGGVASQVPVARVPSIGLASPVTVGRAPVVGGYGIGGAPAFGIGGAPAFGFGSMGLTSDAAQFVKAGLLSTVEEKMNYAEAARAVLEKAYDDGEADAIANAERANNAAQLYFMGSMIGYQGDATGDDWQRMNQLWAMGQSQVAAQAEEDYASAQDDYYASRSADNYKAMQAAMYASQSANYLMMQRALDSRYSVPSAVGSDTANSWLVQTLMSNAEVNMWNVLNGVDTNNGYGGGDNSGLLYNTVFGKNSDGGTEDLFKILMLSGSF